MIKTERNVKFVCFSYNIDLVAINRDIKIILYLLRCQCCAKLNKSQFGLHLTYSATVQLQDWGTYNCTYPSPVFAHHTF